MCVRNWKRSEQGMGNRRRRFTSHHALMIGFVIVASVMAGSSGQVSAQECPDPAPQTSGSHSFRHIGETFDIPISLGDCQAIALTVRWANGRNNGSIFNLTFFDSYDRPLYTKQISAFITGTFEFPLSNFDYQPYGSALVSSVPAMVTVQAAPPFGVPAVLSYTITRANRRPRGARAKLRGIDSALMTSLQTMPGKILAEARTYTLTEVALPEPRELELHGRRKTVRSVFRLMIKGQELVSNSGGRVDLIWIDDNALPVFGDPGSEPGAIIYDEFVLKHNAQLAVSNLTATKLQLLPERLAFQPKVQNFVVNVSSSRAEQDAEAGNEVVGIKNAVRLIGGRRQPLVQIHLRTNRPFPARDSALQLQVGRRFFVDELAGDHTGRNLTLTLTPEMFAEQKDGADIVAFFNRPDRSGNSGGDVWYFGTLNKSMLEQR